MHLAALVTSSTSLHGLQRKLPGTKARLPRQSSWCKSHLQLCCLALWELLARKLFIFFFPLYHNTTLQAPCSQISLVTEFRSMRFKHIFEIALFAFSYWSPRGLTQGPTHHRQAGWLEVRNGVMKYLQKSCIQEKGAVSHRSQQFPRGASTQNTCAAVLQSPLTGYRRSSAFGGAICLVPSQEPRWALQSLAELGCGVLVWKLCPTCAHCQEVISTLACIDISSILFLSAWYCPSNESLPAFAAHDTSAYHVWWFFTIESS